ncbi:DNA-binding transcriptional LysR family regulator [Paenibacillus sp. DS2015]|uniref:LysR family transcriptional regulator n=1 Tax=Paenibacillus sp. DS2015 TaxID=3373917 RepID=UPI003D24E36B
MMSILKLMILVYIEKYKKVTDVAKELNIKQPSVTFHMKSLEEELGTALFESKRGRMLLTEAGKALYPYALKITGLASEAKKVVQDYAALDKGTLHIGVDSLASISPLPKMISDFSKMHTGISLQVSVKPTNSIKQMLINQDVDIVFYYSLDPTENMQEPIQTETLFKDELVVIFGPHHPFTNLNNIDVQHIAKEFFIQHAEESFIKEFTLDLSNNNRIHLWERIQMDSSEAIKLAVNAGEHISFYPKRGITHELACGQLMCLPMPEQTSTPIQSIMASYPDTTHSSLRSEFVQFARKYML